MQRIEVSSWDEVAQLAEPKRTALAFKQALLIFPDGARYRRETGDRLDMHFVVDLEGDERHVHDLFVNVDDETDLYCLRCGPIDGQRLGDEYVRHSESLS